MFFRSAYLYDFYMYLLFPNHTWDDWLRSRAYFGDRFILPSRDVCDTSYGVYDPRSWAPVIYIYRERDIHLHPNLAFVDGFLPLRIVPNMIRTSLPSFGIMTI